MANNLFDDFKNKIPFEVPNVYQYPNAVSYSVAKNGNFIDITVSKGTDESILGNIEKGSTFMLYYSSTRDISISNENSATLRFVNNLGFETYLKFGLGSAQKYLNGTYLQSTVYMDSDYSSPTIGSRLCSNLGFYFTQAITGSIEVQVLLWLQKNDDIN